MTSARLVPCGRRALRLDAEVKDPLPHHIAYRRGSVPEIVEHGLTGLIVENEDEAVVAVRRASMLDRWRVRQRFEERFSVERMVSGYLALYTGLAGFGQRRLLTAQA